ncbi:unnamed protein product [Lactuca virosa]|uniref:PGG domain-containing protein n=1 Tax=Lactuca virosa TaxID=75947 RepID=A0AAU9PGM7_9ASTR|nr:unnamed protein product [Lactuca virosa]
MSEGCADSARTKLEASKDKDAVSKEKEAEGIDVVSEEKQTEDKDEVPTKTVTKETETQDVDAVPVEKNGNGQERIPTKTNIKGEGTETKVDEKIKKQLCEVIMDGSVWDLHVILFGNKHVLTQEINSDGNMPLHIAVGIGKNRMVSEMLRLIKVEQLLEMKNKNGSTALHIAAIVGNTEAAKLLIKRNIKLLVTKDLKGETPLDKAFDNMHLDTVEYLLKAAKGDEKPEKNTSRIGVELLVNAVSSKQYDLAIKLVEDYPEFVVENDNVLMAIARTFPSGLDYGETLIYPVLDNICTKIVERAKCLLLILVSPYFVCKQILEDEKVIYFILLLVLFIILGVPLLMLIWIYVLMRLLILIVYFPFFMFYFSLWKVAAIFDRYAHSHYYTGPILEAARQNAYEVVDEILSRSPEAIRYKDEQGYDIIQLAVIHRSEKIYNLIYLMEERKSIYGTLEDSSKNNMLHLAGRLAPSQKLKRSIGAAFQLQRELQWRKEVKKLVFPAYITKENIFKETPDMVFTREHENLVKEGEKWMKAVAESCSITAGLITTIVFAAAITVPDAMSLFASSTALLMFLSILTGRFSEQDFLHRLPRRMIIGLVTLLLSTTAMMVAFGTNIVPCLCYKRPWMVAPICVLAFLPIAAFSTLQIPIIVDLFRSTYARIFGKPSNNSSIGFIRMISGCILASDTEHASWIKHSLLLPKG